MLLENTHDAASVAGIRQSLADRGVSVRALDFVAVAAQAADTEARQHLLRRALETADVLLSIDADDETVAAALIVTSMPRNAIDVEIVTDAFGSDVWALVNGVQRAGRIDTIAAQAGDAPNSPGLETMRKMLLALADDVRVVLIKLAERVVFMRSITKSEDAIRRAAAKQTNDLFAPLANRLGVFQIKWELEDFSFRFLEPELYKRIASLLDGKRFEREAYIGRVLEALRMELAKLGVDADVAGRPKHIFSIHRKMQSKNIAFEKLYDIRAIRVLVDSVEDCYA
ncbi:MAG: HD domain-containing protein, partial [Usitatibacteraceae bacterium]